MKDGIYRVVFESSLPSFGDGIVVISDGKVHGGDIGFVCRGRLARPVMELSISQYDNELPSVLGMEGNYDLVLKYEKKDDHEYYFTGHVKGDESRVITANAVFITGLLPS
ncbi:TPA: nucleoside transporter [Salmonella enterica]|nr:nucleoside transporter [Salmonella enterica]